MRRATSLRSHNARNSVTSLSDDLGMLREEESAEDALRRQLLAAERENDKLKAQILTMQDQLSQRPPLEQIQGLEREYKSLELLLTGTQRENERCMAEMERGKNREKMLERELAKLAGDNWQTSLNIPANTSASSRSGFLRAGDTSSFFLPQAESTAAILDSTFDASASASFFSSPDAMDSASPSTPRQNNPPANAQTLSSALAHIAQVRALILGMEERMEARENRLTQEVARAEGETRRFEAVRQEVDGVS
ncbi:hypothetical protein DFH11DRAFT_1610467 [Phellopilus nigrolimitatus]|nr:hypothetical protein DFH11DRAFT_1610467 [Phellopilus nigrolimitatus]